MLDLILFKNLIDIDTREGRAFSYIIYSLIVLSLITFSLETIPSLNLSYRIYLYYAEIIIVSVFSVEYLIRIYLSKNKLRFIFSFYGIVDLIAILPFYISSGVDLRTLRALRLLRIFRIFKLFKYTSAIENIKSALVSIREELIVFLIASIILLYLAATGIYYFENDAQPDNFSSIFDCLWWAVATLTTVGYGDMFPITTGGRFFTTIVVFIGLGIIAVPTGLFANSLNYTYSKRRDK